MSTTSLPDAPISPEQEAMFGIGGGLAEPDLDKEGLAALDKVFEELGSVDAVVKHVRMYAQHRLDSAHPRSLRIERLEDRGGRSRQQGGTVA